MKNGLATITSFKTVVIHFPFYRNRNELSIFASVMGDAIPAFFLGCGTDGYWRHWHSRKKLLRKRAAPHISFPWEDYSFWKGEKSPDKRIHYGLNRKACWIEIQTRRLCWTNSSTLLNKLVDFVEQTRRLCSAVFSALKIETAKIENWDCENWK